MAAGLDDPVSLPVRPQKKPKPVRDGAVFIIRNDKGDYLLGKRAERGLLGGMLAFPSYGWDGSSCPNWIEDGSFAVTYQAQEQQLRHVFTHFTAAITLYVGTAGTQAPPEGYRWQACSPDSLPSLMAKCYHAAKP